MKVGKIKGDKVNVLMAKKIFLKIEHIFSLHFKAIEQLTNVNKMEKENAGKLMEFNISSKLGV